MFFHTMQRDLNLVKIHAVNLLARSTGRRCRNSNQSRCFFREELCFLRSAFCPADFCLRLVWPQLSKQNSFVGESYFFFAQAFAVIEKMSFRGQQIFIDFLKAEWSRGSPNSPSQAASFRKTKAASFKWNGGSWKKVADFRSSFLARSDNGVRRATSSWSRFHFWFSRAGLKTSWGWFKVKLAIHIFRQRTISDSLTGKRGQEVWILSVAGVGISCGPNFSKFFSKPSEKNVVPWVWLFVPNETECAP